VVTLILLFVLVAIAVGFTVALGAGPLVAAPVIIAFAIGIWLLVALIRGHTPGRAVRRTDRPELLGPGGPDDPEA
jgi:hypothetical protein